MKGCLYLFHLLFIHPSLQSFSIQYTLLSVLLWVLIWTEVWNQQQQKEIDGKNNKKRNKIIIIHFISFHCIFIPLHLYIYWIGQKYKTQDMCIYYLFIKVFFFFPSILSKSSSYKMNMNNCCYIYYYYNHNHNLI